MVESENLVPKHKFVHFGENMWWPFYRKETVHQPTPNPEQIDAEVMALPEIFEVAPIAEPVTVEQPAVEMVKEPVTVEQPAVEMVKEPVTVEQPAVEMVKEPVTVEQPAVEMVKEPVTVEQPAVEMVKEPVTVEQPAVEMVKEPVTVEQPAPTELKEAVQSVATPHPANVKETVPLIPLRSPAGLLQERLMWLFDQVDDRPTIVKVKECRIRTSNMWRVCFQSPRLKSPLFSPVWSSCFRCQVKHFKQD